MNKTDADDNFWYDMALNMLHASCEDDGILWACVTQ